MYSMNKIIFATITTGIASTTASYLYTSYLHSASSKEKELSKNKEIINQRVKFAQNCVTQAQEKLNKNEQNYKKKCVDSKIPRGWLFSTDEELQCANFDKIIKEATNKLKENELHLNLVEKEAILLSAGENSIKFALLSDQISSLSEKITRSAEGIKRVITTEVGDVKSHLRSQVWFSLQPNYTLQLNGMECAVTNDNTRRYR